MGVTRIGNRKNGWNDVGTQPPKSTGASSGEGRVGPSREAVPAAPAPPLYSVPLSFPYGAGLETMFQACPFQCSVNVLDNPCPKLPPTAQAFLWEMPATALRPVLVEPLGLGLETTLQV